MLCRIALAVGEIEACPRGGCPFWEHGGSLGAGCGLERLQLELDRPDLAEYLGELRRALETARDERGRKAARNARADLGPPDLTGR